MDRFGEGSSTEGGTYSPQHGPQGLSSVATGRFVLQLTSLGVLCTGKKFFMIPFYYPLIVCTGESHYFGCTDARSSSVSARLFAYFVNLRVRVVAPGARRASTEVDDSDR